MAGSTAIGSRRSGRAASSQPPPLKLFSRPQDFGSADTFGKIAPVHKSHWFFDEGHADCVFDVAERAARVAGVDSVRVRRGRGSGRGGGRASREEAV